MSDHGTGVLTSLGLTIEELYRIAEASADYGRVHPEGFVLNISEDATVDEVGKQIDQGEYSSKYFNPPLYWKHFKHEIFLFLCTKNKKYQKLRLSLANSNDKAQLTVVSTISAAVAGSLGVTAGALVPVCAICFIGILKLGKEAFCQAQKLDVKLSPD